MLLVDKRSPICRNYLQWAEDEDPIDQHACMKQSVEEKETGIHVSFTMCRVVQTDRS